MSKIVEPKLREERHYKFKKKSENIYDIKVFFQNAGVCKETEVWEIDITTLEGAQTLFEIKEELTHKAKNGELVKAAIRTEEKITSLESEDRLVKITFDAEEEEDLVMKSENRLKAIISTMEEMPKVLSK